MPTLAEIVENYPYKFAPFNHQKTALLRGCGKRWFGYLMEMGTGKTKVTIDETCIQFDHGHVTGLLVCAPKGVYRNWLKELKDHKPYHIKLVIGLWKGRLGANDSRFFAALNTPEPGVLKVLLINVEAFQLRKAQGVRVAEEFLRGHGKKSKMVVDESTTIASTRSTRTKIVTKLGGLATFRRILTGSPGDDPRKIFPQAQFLQDRSLGFSSPIAFRNRYCLMKETPLRPGPNGEARSFQLLLGFRRLDELQENLKTFTYRVTKRECLDLPEKIYALPREVPLTEEQDRLYREMRDKAVAYLDEHKKTEGYVSAPIALTQALRLHQIVCGMLKTDDGVEHDVPNNRINALMDVLAETGEKVIIWANYRRNIEVIHEQIVAEYGAESVVQYYGATSSDDRTTAVERFQNDPKCRFFVGNPSTGGYGITLTAASVVVYFSNSYRLEHRIQSEDRAHRIGQHNPVLYVDLVSPGTVDTRIVHALAKKLDVAAQLTGDELQQWLDVSALGTPSKTSRARSVGSDDGGEVDSGQVAGGAAVQIDGWQLDLLEDDRLR